MSLRDRIAKTLYDVALNWSDELRHEWGDLNEDLREAWRRDADAILSDPEIAALIEVARLANEMAAQAHAKGSVTFDVVREMLAALARLEEARRG